MEIVGRMVRVRGQVEIGLEKKEILVEGKAADYLPRDFILYLSNAVVIEPAKITMANEFLMENYITGASAFAAGQYTEVHLRRARVEEVDGKDISHYYGTDIRNWTAVALCLKFGPDFHEEVGRMERLQGRRHNMGKDFILECLHNVRKDFYLENKPTDETFQMILDVAGA